jgi:hypothetical protein
MSNMLHNQSCRMHFPWSIHYACGKNNTHRQNRRNCGSLFLDFCSIFFLFENWEKKTSPKKLFFSTNGRNVLSNTSLSNKPYKIELMIILHGTIFIMHTTIFPGQENDFFPLRTVSMLNLPENSHFNLLKVISERVESMADKKYFYKGP